MALFFSSSHLEEEKNIDKIITTLSNEILSNHYQYVIINCGNFLLWQNNNDVFPLIPELYEDEKWNVIDQEKHDLCFNWWALYNTRFSLKSLEIWLNVLFAVRSSFLSQNINILPILSVDDKYVDKEKSLDYLHRWYNAIPSKYREILQESFAWLKNAKNIVKIIPNIFKDSWQKVTNDFILSENELVWRFMTIRKQNANLIKQEYKNYQESLADKTRKCSLELFHLLKVLVNEKDNIDNRPESRLCIMQFIPDACEWSAIASAKSIVKDREDIDIISIVPIMTWEDVFVITKFNRNGQQLI